MPYTGNAISNREFYEELIMANKKFLQSGHFQVNGITGFVEIEPINSLWVNFSGVCYA